MNERLRAALDGYLELRCHLDPVEATFIGRHEHDGRFGRYDQDSVREALAALRSYTSELEEAGADTVEEEIDRTAALHAARHDILMLERERPFARNPEFHLSHALNGLFLLLVRAPHDPAQRANALLSRLRALPEFLDTAKERLTNPSRVFIETASDMLAGGHALLGDGLDDPSLDLTALEPAELEDARVRAADALLTFGDALALLSESARDDFAIGRDLFDRKLHTAHMIQENADELARLGERMRASAEAELRAASATIAPGVHWRDVVDRLRADVPRPDTAIAEYDDAMQSAREFTIERRLMAVTPSEIQVAPTPDFLRALTPVAAYLGAGAYDQDQRGLFLVTLPDDGQPWRAHCRAELPSAVAHEGIPGHHQQIAIRNALPQPVRRVITTPASLEGWAMYCEHLMAEQGFLRTPEEKLFAAHHLLWRALRVVLDVSLHTRGMSRETAARKLQDELGIDAAVADAEARRYCAHPTYQLCYAVGLRDILRLRDDARRAGGDSFSLAAFHDALLSYGALPIVLARWGMGLA
ncbi:MAG TPA: DUF885 domain-containing protein [Gemmatimonadaceae bacterium]|nr:DUF885 domain-containing protein [Gemmatimonadaceae bacterium]